MILRICLFSALIALTGCFTPKPVLYKGVKNFDVTSAGGTSVIRMDVMVQNPNGIGIRLAGLKGDISLGTSNIGKARLGKAKNISANAESLVPLEISFTDDQLSLALPAAFSIFSGGKVQLKAEGELKIRKLLFFQKRYAFTWSEMADQKMFMELLN